MAAFSIDQATGEPKLMQNIDGRGVQLRTFGIDPSGRILIAASIVSSPVRRETTSAPSRPVSPFFAWAATAGLNSHANTTSLPATGSNSGPEWSHRHRRGSSLSAQAAVSLLATDSAKLLARWDGADESIVSGTSELGSASGGDVTNGLLAGAAHRQRRDDRSNQLLIDPFHGIEVAAPNRVTLRNAIGAEARRSAVG